MADQRTMTELLRAPTEGYAEAIVVPSILAEQFELKHSLINMMTSDQFFGLEKDNPHDHIRWDNIQGYVAAAAVNYNQGNSGYRPLGVANQIRPPGFAQPNVQNNQNRFSQPQRYNRGNNFNQDQSYQAPTQQNQVVPLSELEKIKRVNEANMKAMQTQINNVKNELRNEMKNSIQASINTITNPKGKLKAITTRSGIVLDGPSIPIPPPFINPEEDKRIEETLTDQDLAKYTIKLHINITLVDALILIQKYQKMLKALLSNKEKLLELTNTPLNENFSAVILKKLLEKLRDPRKFLIPCSFSELKCKALANLESSLSWERHFLRTTCALIDIHREEMILRDGDERLTLNMRHDTSSYSIQPQKESINMINIYNDSSEDFLENLIEINHQSCNPTFSSHPDLTSPEVKDDIFDLEGGNVLPEKLLDLYSTKDLHPHHNINSLSGSTTSSSPNHLLEEFADELALITFPPRNDDLPFEIKFDLKDIEYLLHHDPIKDMDSILKDSIDQSNLVDLNDNLVDTMPEIFTDEHALDYSSPPLYDEYDDNLFEVEFDAEYVYDDPLTPRERKSKSILIRENLLEVITRIAPGNNVKKLAISHAFLILKDFDAPLYELYFFKEVPRSKTLLLFSSENEEKVFKPVILTSKEVHSSLIPELSHQGYKFSKSTKFIKTRWRFLFSLIERTSTSWMFFVSTFTLPDQLKYGGIGSS
nr:hypothetical protein [Tanacetum cinerariifolium]